MAQAEKKTITETKVVETPGVTLTLTHDEAAVVRAAVGAVGGVGALATTAGEVYRALSGKTGGKNYYASGGALRLQTDVPW